MAWAQEFDVQGEDWMKVRYSRCRTGISSHYGVWPWISRAFDNGTLLG